MKKKIKKNPNLEGKEFITHEYFNLLIKALEMCIQSIENTGLGLFNNPLMKKLDFELALKIYTEAFNFRIIGWNKCEDCELPHKSLFGGQCRCEYFDKDDFTPEDLKNQIIYDIIKYANKFQLEYVYKKLIFNYFPKDVIEKIKRRIIYKSLMKKNYLD